MKLFRLVAKSSILLGIMSIIVNAWLGVTPIYAADWNTNLTGDTAISGTWTKVSGDGLKGVSGAGANAFDMANSDVEMNFVFEADVKVDASSPNGVGSLVFRSNADGSKSYVVSLDPNLDQIRLFDYATGSNVGTPYSAALNTGTFYHLKIAVDGPSIKVYLANTLAISVTDYRYEAGNIGFHLYNGTAAFQNAYLYETSTNVTGWTPTGGTLTNTELGWKATTGSGQNMYAISTASSDNFVYEADINVLDAQAVGTLLFRSNSSATNAYGVQIDPNLDRIRLFKTNGDVTLSTYSTAVNTNTVYKVKVKVEGTSIKVFWDTKYDPVMTISDNSLTSGLVGLNAYNGNVIFQNVLISSMNTNLRNWTVTNGSWNPHLDGVKAVTNGASNTFRVSGAQVGDFVMEGDLKVDPSTPDGTAAMLFRGNKAGTTGYVVSIDPNLDRVRLFDASNGTTLATVNKSIDTGRVYHLEIVGKGASIKVYVDGYSAPAISITNSLYSSGLLGLSVYNGTAYFQNVYGWAYSDYYTEKYRPQYHYSMAHNWISDPNGLVYYQGEYHLFAQDGGKWTHAVSSDLVHWKRLPIALPWTDNGHIWSGSAVADLKNASGLFNGGSGLIAYYTMYHPDKANGNQKIGIAYSKDNGRTWTYYSGNPIIQNPGGADGGWDFRDPKVVWDSDHNKWIMVVSGGDHIRFFTSTDLINWTYASSFGYGAYVYAGVWECPDFFQLPVDGNPANKKWVLNISTGGSKVTGGSATEYFVGSFDGTTFTNDNKAGTVLRNESGKDFYASMSFSNIPAADGRRIWLGWMSNWDYPFGFPTTAWKGIMSVPRTLSLKTFSEGVRLVQTPITEIDSLRGPATSWSNITLTPSSTNLLSGINSSAYEIDAEFELPTSGAATEFGFRLRQGGDQQTFVGYLPGSSKMFVNRADAGEDGFSSTFPNWQEASLLPESKRIKMRILVDESSVEMFGNDGKVTFSDTIFPDPTSKGMSIYTLGGNVNLVSLKYYPLANTWR